MSDLLTLHGIGLRHGTTSVLHDISLTLAPGETCGIAGPSGAGKTSLLHIAGLLRGPDAGEVRWNGVSTTRWTDAARTAWRRSDVGFVFQEFHLLPELSALENVLLPSHFGRSPRRQERAAALLGRVGITSLQRRAGLLSRGEQQRLAIARALLHQPKLILADEPTASLDADSAAQVSTLLLDQARDVGAAMLIVSHDPSLLGRLGRTLHLSAGRLSS